LGKYEKLATQLLNRFAKELDLELVQEKQKIKGNRSGLNYEIDAKGILSNGDGFVIVECRKHVKQRQKQENIAALAYRIHDTHAAGGIIVTPFAFTGRWQKDSRRRKNHTCQINP
jgi:hypothetical protein